MEMLQPLFGRVTLGLGRALELYEARHRVLTENLANAETPGYRARDLDFASELAEAFDDDVPRSGSVPEAVEDQSLSVKIDRNSVDVDHEMARLSDNSLRLLALSRIVARKYRGLKGLITELGR